MARDYDLGIIINPDVGDEQARTIVERLTQLVGTKGGQVVRVNAWGRKHLAYPIQRHRDGLYFWFDLILPPEAVADIERMLRVNEDVIRHLIRLRDPRTVGQARQREAELDAQAAAHAAAQAARSEALQAATPEVPAESAGAAEGAETLAAPTPAPTSEDEAEEGEPEVAVSGAEAQS